MRQRILTAAVAQTSVCAGRRWRRSSRIRGNRQLHPRCPPQQQKKSRDKKPRRDIPGEAHHASHYAIQNHSQRKNEAQYVPAPPLLQCSGILWRALQSLDRGSQQFGAKSSCDSHFANRQHCKHHRQECRFCLRCNLQPAQEKKQKRGHSKKCEVDDPEVAQGLPSVGHPLLLSDGVGFCKAICEPPGRLNGK
jgi:hypothetical protein